ncbi:MAG TPA: F0F1 ATP synthase subunit delta [bacterium]|jgi:F0F1-type ATP synthase delta subunit|nr:F0F1 ATP synthase subunit delta [bacterium]
MTAKLLARATAQLLIEKPKQADTILARLEFLLNTKYRQVNKRFLNETLRKELCHARNIEQIKIASQKQLSPTERETITAKLGKKHHYEWTVDESLLGGLVVKITDRELDLSVRKNIEKIKESFLTVG